MVGAAKNNQLVRNLSKWFQTIQNGYTPITNMIQYVCQCLICNNENCTNQLKGGIYGVLS